MKSFTMILMMMTTTMMMMLFFSNVVVLADNCPPNSFPTTKEDCLAGIENCGFQQFTFQFDGAECKINGFPACLCNQDLFCNGSSVPCPAHSSLCTMNGKSAVYWYGSCSSTPSPCLPICNGRDCGDNSCGGLCGSCDESFVCNITTGKCDKPFTPTPTPTPTSSHTISGDIIFVIVITLIVIASSCMFIVIFIRSKGRDFCSCCVRKSRTDDNDVHDAYREVL